MTQKRSYKQYPKEFKEEVVDTGMSGNSMAPKFKSSQWYRQHYLTNFLPNSFTSLY